MSMFAPADGNYKVHSVSPAVSHRSVLGERVSPIALCIWLCILPFPIGRPCGSVHHSNCKVCTLNLTRPYKNDAALVKLGRSCRRTACSATEVNRGIRICCKHFRRQRLMFVLARSACTTPSSPKYECSTRARVPTATHYCGRFSNCVLPRRLPRRGRRCAFYCDPAQYVLLFV